MKFGNPLLLAEGLGVSRDPFAESLIDSGQLAGAGSYTLGPYDVAGARSVRIVLEVKRTTAAASAPFPIAVQWLDTSPLGLSPTGLGAPNPPAPATPVWTPQSMQTGYMRTTSSNGDATIVEPMILDVPVDGTSVLVLLNAFVVDGNTYGVSYTITASNRELPWVRARQPLFQSATFAGQMPTGDVWQVSDVCPAGNQHNIPLPVISGYASFGFDMLAGAGVASNCFLGIFTEAAPQTVVGPLFFVATANTHVQASAVLRLPPMPCTLRLIAPAGGSVTATGSIVYGPDY